MKRTVTLNKITDSSEFEQCWRYLSHMYVVVCTQLNKIFNKDCFYAEMLHIISLKCSVILSSKNVRPECFLLFNLKELSLN